MTARPALCLWIALPLLIGCPFGGDPADSAAERAASNRLYLAEHVDEFIEKGDVRGLRGYVRVHAEGERAEEARSALEKAYQEAEDRYLAQATGASDKAKAVVQALFAHLRAGGSQTLIVEIEKPGDYDLQELGQDYRSAFGDRRERARAQSVVLALEGYFNQHFPSMLRLRAGRRAEGSQDPRILLTPRCHAASEVTLGWKKWRTEAGSSYVTDQGSFDAKSIDVSFSAQLEVPGTAELWLTVEEPAQQVEGSFGATGGYYSAVIDAAYAAVGHDLARVYGFTNPEDSLSAPGAFERYVDEYATEKELVRLDASARRRAERQ